MDRVWKVVQTKGEPVGRHETSFVECGGQFYLIGGREAEGRIDCFDPKEMSWKKMKATSPLIHHFQPVVVDGQIIMIGAMTNGYPDEPPISHICTYDPLTDIWSKGPEIPAERRRGSSGVVVYNNKIYLVGGITLGHTSGTSGWFDEYDMRTNTWKKLEDAPHIRDHFHGIVVDDKLYCIGGRNTSYHEPDNFEAFFGAVILEVDVYDFITEKWVTLPEKANLPMGSAAGGVAHLDDRIIYFGGENATEALAGTWALDPVKEEWHEVGTLNQGRHGSQALVYEDNLYVVAGSPVRGGGNVTSMEIFCKK